MLRATLLLLLAAGLAGCGKPPESNTPVAVTPPAATAIAAPRDVHSYANTAAFRVEHLRLDLNVDFEKQILEGSAELHLKRLDASASELLLDSRALNILAAEAATGTGAFQPTTFKLDAADALLGSALHVAMPPGADRVRIHYQTSPEASGLQWLKPAQTSGKKLPFLFSQSQSIHARSWVPLQDSPAVRFTYEAQIHTPKNLLALMSAENDPAAPRNGEYAFRMSQPVPSYLLALAVGDLRFARLGERNGIYAEPAVLQKAAREFADTEAMILAAEKIYGPYRWGRYDLLILPPSFPFGGMENPRLTFATPTVIAGDKSLVALVAHELAHSWSGNLVTNASWRDFWLNESFTSYFTNRIMEAVYGVERADMERALDANELKRGLADVPAERRMLAPAKPPVDADDTPSVIVYNKGALFLYNLELAFGRENFDAFLQSWFDEHAFSSQTTETFVAFLNERLLAKQPGKFAPEKVQAWVYEAEIPADARYPSSSAFEQLDAARSDWLAGKLSTTALKAKDWNMLHWAYFLDNLPAVVPLAKLAELDRAYRLTASQNHVLLASWLPIAITSGYSAADAAVRRHLLAIGRGKLLRPVYAALVKTPAGRARAQAIYAEARPGYHSIVRSWIDQVFVEKK